MSNITVQDLLQNRYERADFDEVEYVEIFHLYTGLCYHLHTMENLPTPEARRVILNYTMLRDMIVDKLQEPGYSWN